MTCLDGSKASLSSILTPIFHDVGLQLQAVVSAASITRASVVNGEQAD